MTLPIKRSGSFHPPGPAYSATSACVFIQLVNAAQLAPSPAIRHEFPQDINVKCRSNWHRKFRDKWILIKYNRKKWQTKRCATGIVKRWVRRSIPIVPTTQWKIHRDSCFIQCITKFCIITKGSCVILRPAAAVNFEVSGSCIDHPNYILLFEAVRTWCRVSRRSTLFCTTRSIQAKFHESGTFFWRFLVSNPVTKWFHPTRKFFEIFDHCSIYVTFFKPSFVNINLSITQFYEHIFKN